jgi:hypothetical protein
MSQAHSNPLRRMSRLFLDISSIYANLGIRPATDCRYIGTGKSGLITAAYPPVAVAMDYSGARTIDKLESVIGEASNRELAELLGVTRPFLSGFDDGWFSMFSDDPPSSVVMAVMGREGLDVEFVREGWNTARLAALALDPLILRTSGYPWA